MRKKLDLTPEERKVHMKEKAVRWYQANKERLKEDRKSNPITREKYDAMNTRNREKYAEDPTKMKEYNRKQYVKKREKRLQYQREYYAKMTPEHQRARNKVCYDNAVARKQLKEQGIDSGTN
jgi:hypothetical protein